MNNELFSRLKDLAQKENRARLAVLLGAAAMLLILLSESAKKTSYTDNCK